MLGAACPVRLDQHPRQRDTRDRYCGLQAAFGSSAVGVSRSNTTPIPTPAPNPNQTTSRVLSRCRVRVTGSHVGGGQNGQVSGGPNLGLVSDSHGIVGIPIDFRSIERTRKGIAQDA